MYRAVDHALLGTTVRLSIGASRLRSSARIARSVFTEMHRLSRVFNRFDPASELSRVREGRLAVDDADRDLSSLLEQARQWSELSGGRFDPYFASDEPGGGSGIDEAALDLNAIAKGWIVDRAAERSRGWSSLVVDAGGDVLHRGQGTVRVAIENPRQPWDNAEPLVIVELGNEAIATSGPTRRGDHLRDPRSGDVPEAVIGASVVAADAATSDVVATVLAVGTPDEGVTFANSLRLAALVVAADGRVATSTPWQSRFGSVDDV